MAQTSSRSSSWTPYFVSFPSPTAAMPRPEPASPLSQQLQLFPSPASPAGRTQPSRTAGGMPESWEGKAQRRSMLGVRHDRSLLTANSPSIATRIPNICLPEVKGVGALRSHCLGLKPASPFISCMILGTDLPSVCLSFFSAKWF